MTKALTPPALTVKAGVTLELPETGGDDHNPYRFFAEQHDDGPAQRINLPGMERAWLVSGFDNIQQVLCDPRFRREPLGYSGPIDLAAVRRILAPALERSERFCGPTRLNENAVTLARSLRSQSGVDLVSDFVHPFTSSAFEMLLAVPDEDAHWFRSHILRFSPLASERGYNVDETDIRGLLQRYLLALIERSAGISADNFFTSLVRSKDQDRTPPKIAETTLLMLAAGYEPAMHLFSSALLQLLRRPDITTLLRNKPELISTVANELVQVDSPVFPGVIRHLACDLDYLDARMHKGDVVLLPVASAGRDRSKVDPPDVIDVGGGTRRHLAFGFGPHHCIGSTFAMRILIAGIQAFASELHDAQLCIDRSPRWSRQHLRALLELPVSLNR